MDGQYRPVREGLGIRHLRTVIGNSMGGMHAWLWGTKHPGDFDASPGLERIQATVLAINAADDERNPPSAGIMLAEWCPESCRGQRSGPMRRTAGSRPSGATPTPD